jgi:single-strand DNA-binding protein
MANFNKVILIGRLTREPEFVNFASGGRVAKFGFAVTNRRKNAKTGEWEDEPMFIDCEAFNRGDFGKLADTVERFAHKGTQLCLEGKLHLDQWEDKNGGGKRSKHKIVVDAIQLLDPRQAEGEGGAPRPAAARGPAPAPARGNGYNRPAPRDEYDDADEPAQGGHGADSEIPF